VQKITVQNNPYVMYVINAKTTVSTVEKTDVIYSIAVWSVKDPRSTVSAVRLLAKADDVRNPQMTADVIDARITAFVVY